MSYFESTSQHAKIYIDPEEEFQLREAQVGAIHATLSHFTIHKDPALIVMPTGSGKSVVLMSLPYFLKAKRVLILTPSQILRDQIYEDFCHISSLKKYGVLPNTCEAPKIKAIKSKIKNTSEWTSLKNSDVIIGTPNCVSPATNGVGKPPKDFFDLILVDEAHHSSARTWKATLDSFPNAKKILVTATPFRNDKKEIKSKVVYAYPLNLAFKEKIFGKIEFIPVSEAPPGDDIAIAKAAAKALKKDQDQKFDHSLIVRTDSKKKANELYKLYKKHTNLKLEVIHSGRSYTFVKKSIAMLKEGKLDGVIAVSMLGEGFDFPNLKIAAIHTPHKSLAITLQFIGRFARTTKGKGKFGVAKFIAIPNDIRIESEKLYKEEASWQDIVTNLVATQVEQEIQRKQDLESFKIDQQFDSSELSLYSLKPSFHVKIYRVPKEINLHASIEKVQARDVIWSAFSDDLQTRVLLCRQGTKPDWVDSQQVAEISYELHILYYDQKSRLLFINSSDKSFSVYEELVEILSPDGYRILPLTEINRVIRGFENSDFFNIGMKNSFKGGKTESYRIIAGPNAQNAISKSDGVLFHRGHVFGKGQTDGKNTTLGYSSASKVWAHGSGRVSDLVNWCKRHANNIHDPAPIKTNSNLDFLAVGELVNEIESPVLFIEWAPGLLRKDIYIKHKKTDSTFLYNCSIEPITQTKTSVTFKIVMKESTIQYKFDLSAGTFFKAIDHKAEDVMIHTGTKAISLESFLNDEPLDFYLSGFSRLRLNEIFKRPPLTGLFEAKKVIPFDWSRTSIVSETDRSKRKGKLESIQATFSNYLQVSDADIVFIDDRSGEIADFITIKELANEIKISLYHCKASSKDKPGHRIDDLYEVCGQCVKSMLRIQSVDHLLKRMEDRIAGGSTFVTGSLGILRQIGRNSLKKKISFEIFAVQPGVSASNMPEHLHNELFSTDNFLTKVRDVDFKLICSK